MKQFDHPWMQRSLTSLGMGYSRCRSFSTLTNYFNVHPESTLLDRCFLASGMSGKFAHRPCRS
jgi:hypothetical protein